MDTRISNCLLRVLLIFASLSDAGEFYFSIGEIIWIGLYFVIFICIYLLLFMCNVHSDIVLFSKMNTFSDSYF